jgi:hypothetical protein
MPQENYHEKRVALWWQVVTYLAVISLIILSKTLS